MSPFVPPPYSAMAALIQAEAAAAMSAPPPLAYARKHTVTQEAGEWDVGVCDTEQQDDDRKDTK